jgi:protein arginine phosphatase
MPSVLIVCTANICRSPMAAAILRQLVAKRQDANEWRIESAGTWANYGSPAATMSRFVMESMGMNISTHQSQPVRQNLIQQFDLILTMERNHKEALQVGFPEFANHIYMLSEIIGLEQDIWDPIGGELADYRETAQELEHILSIGLERIDQLARSLENK